MSSLVIRFLRRGFDNITLKLLSVGLAVLMFIFVRGDREEEAGLSVPMVVEPDPSRVLVSGALNSLKVKVRGKSSKIRKAISGDFEPVQLDLKSLTDGEHFFSAESINLPLGVRVVSIQPASTELRFEPSVTRELEVEAALTGKHDSAFVLTDRRVEPPMVKVRGAKSEVLALKRVRTLAIDVGGHWENSVVQVGLASPGTNVVFDPPIDRVRVRLRFEARVGQRDFDKVPVRPVGNSRYAVTIKPALAKVRLEGPLNVLRSLDPGDLEADIEIKDLDDKPPGTHRRKLTVGGLPASVKLLRTRPKSFHVTTKQRPGPATPQPAMGPADAKPAGDLEPSGEKL